MLAIVPTPPVLGANYAVDTNVDDGLTNLTACTPTVTDCSLRGALSNAGLSSPPDTITFDASIANEIITLSSALTLSGAGGDTIDGAGTGVTIRGNDSPRPSVAST